MLYPVELRAQVRYVLATASRRYRILKLLQLILVELVGAVGFELTTLCSQSRCATRLRYAPRKRAFYNLAPLWSMTVDRIPESGARLRLLADCLPSGLKQDLTRAGAGGILLPSGRHRDVVGAESGCHWRLDQSIATGERDAQ